MADAWVRAPSTDSRFARRRGGNDAHPFVVKRMAMKWRHQGSKVRFPSKESVTYDSAHDLEEVLLPPAGSSHGLKIHPGPDNLAGLKCIFIHPFSVLLVFIPLGVASGVCRWPSMMTFWFNFAALIPLAKILGDGTEELAAALHNDAASGLLNATFGNAVEMILTIVAITKNDIVLVKTSLLGSILSNCLLVLGMSFFLGGLTPSTTRSPEDIQSWHRCILFDKEQRFPVKGAITSMGLLLLSIMCFALPGLFPSNHCEEVRAISRFGAVLIVSCYIAFLMFQLFTHSATLTNEEHEIDAANEVPDDEADVDDEAASLTVWCSVLLMFLTALCISLNSELLVGSVEQVVSQYHMPLQFIGVILVPIVGNACEHAGAVRFAMRDKPGLAIGIAVGSSTQVALLVVPFSVIVGWLLDKNMDLNFGLLNTVVLLMGTLVTLTVLLDGRANWLKGYMLMAAYMFIAVLYWFVPPTNACD